VYVNRAFEVLFQVRREAIVDRAPVSASGSSVDLLRPSAPVISPSMVNTSTFVTTGGETLRLGIFHGSGSIEALSDELEMTRAELLATRAELQRLRSVDPVTQCLSRGAVTARLSDTDITLAHTAGVMRLVIDGFDQITEAHGRDVADQALVHFTEIVRKNIRTNDLFGRIGEADFTVVLPGASRDITAGAARRISQSVASNPFDAGVAPISLTVRIGATFSDDQSLDLHHLVDVAEVALSDAASDPSLTVFV
jgi:diguanylate cyclase (GGDEF)-like protein